MKSPSSCAYLMYLLLLVLFVSLTDASNNHETESTTSQINIPAPTLRWASTGGGWRSQFACVGFANLFSKLNIMSKFSAISTTSGASWFSTQLFYSQQFYDRVVHANDSSALYDFVVEWMDAYKEMLVDTIETSTTMTEELGKEVCNFTDLGDGVDIENLSDLCHTIVYFGGDWAASKLLYLCISYVCISCVSFSKVLSMPPTLLSDGKDVTLHIQIIWGYELYKEDSRV